MIDYIILPEQRLIIERLRGPVSLSGLEATTERIWRDSAYDMAFDSIIDVREADLDLDVGDVKALTDLILSSGDASRGSVAILSTTPVETALSYLFSRRMTTQNPVAVFSTVGAVGGFLGLSPSLLETLEDDQTYDALFETGQSL